MLVIHTLCSMAIILIKMLTLHFFPPINFNTKASPNVVKNNIRCYFLIHTTVISEIPSTSLIEITQTPSTLCPSSLLSCSSSESRVNVNVKSLSHVCVFVTPWTVAYQAPLHMGFSRQEYWSGLSFPSPGDLPYPGIDPGSPTL